MPGWIAGWAGRALYLVPRRWEICLELKAAGGVFSLGGSGVQEMRIWVCTEPEQPQTGTGDTWAGRSGDPSGGPTTLPNIFISKAQNILQFWLDDWHEEEDVSKSEWAPQVTCWGGVIREIATLKLLLGSSALAVPLQRVVRLDCAFPGDFTIEGWHWWAGKGLNAGQLMRVGPDEDDISTSPCIWHVCSNRITGESSTLL